MFMASQEALVEAILKAMELGYQHVIFFYWSQKDVVYLVMMCEISKLYASNFNDKWWLEKKERDYWRWIGQGSSDG